jgi:hypothetical protein
MGAMDVWITVIGQLAFAGGLVAWARWRNRQGG